MTEAAKQALQKIKPKLRGWQHAGAIPAAVICGIILVVLSPSNLRLAATIYSLSTIALFTVSATFHRGTWGPKMYAFLRRADHATIFLLIAGSYTPFVVVLVGGNSGTQLLWIIWTAALIGMVFRVVWIGAPKAVTVPVYITLGCTALLYTPTIWSTGGAAIYLLLLGGGAFYIAGAVIYGIGRPDPSPRWFGFHEIFHSCTLGGYVTHYVGISLAIYGVAGTAAAVR
ncbi:MAG: hemolysin III family protein [Actinomycetes bacterium]